MIVKERNKKAREKMLEREELVRKVHEYRQKGYANAAIAKILNVPEVVVYKAMITMADYKEGV